MNTQSYGNSFSTFALNQSSIRFFGTIGGFEVICEKRRQSWIGRSRTAAACMNAGFDPVIHFGLDPTYCVRAKTNLCWKGGVVPRGTGVQLVVDRGTRKARTSLKLLTTKYAYCGRSCSVLSHMPSRWIHRNVPE